MGPTVTLLLSIVICVEWHTGAEMGTLLKPTFWAVPGPVVPKHANVTLRCQGQEGSETFELWRDGVFINKTHASGHLAEFVISKVDDRKDARNYSCRFGLGSLWSELSEPLALVVMTDYPRPSMSVSPASQVDPGKTVTFSCQMSPQPPSQDYSFALLEANNLKPLKDQSPGRPRADFTLESVRVQDTGSYSCVYYKTIAPHRGSCPSQTMELSVTGPLPRPSLWTQPGHVVAPGTNVTVWCLRPKLYSDLEVTFSLEKVGSQDPPRVQESAELWAGFLLPSVRPEDTGSYSCAYRDKRNTKRTSESSDALELVVPGSLPRPSLSVTPGLVVEPGTHVMLRCQKPPQVPLWRGMEFVLLKMGTPQPLQTQSPVDTWTDFPLFSVRAKDAGSYSCLYYGTTVPYQVSELSEELEIWVTDALPKPSLSAWPGTEVASGTNVTLLCRGPSWSTRFVLYKEGEEEILPTLETTQEGAQFFLTHVTPKHSGNYSCSYQPGTGVSFRTEPSEPLELRVRDSGPRITFIIMLTGFSFFVLILLFLCVFILCHRSVPMGSLQGDNFRRYLCCTRLPWGTSLPSETQSLRQDPLYTEMSKDRTGEESVSMAEDSQEVTYAQLNIRKMKERKGYTSGMHNEPTL